MVISSTGTAYIGPFGFDIDALTQSKGWKWVQSHVLDPEMLAPIIKVSPSGHASIAAHGLAFPNGPVLIDDEKTYLVAETFAHRISAFDVAPDGTLGNKRVWAETGKGISPDGVCWDEKRGGLWVGNGAGNDVSLLCSLARQLSTDAQLWG
jgi:sugar lactone lactonase YvrE